VDLLLHHRTFVKCIAFQTAAAISRVRWLRVLALRSPKLSLVVVPGKESKAVLSDYIYIDLTTGT
jgi:hypothetical protein